MKETVVHHLTADECVITSREAAPSLDVLEQRPVHDPVVYPVIETWLTGQANGDLSDPQPTPQARVWHRFTPGCFHDLFSASDQELAGMGLAIIGNLCRQVSSHQLSTQADAKLILKRAKAAEEIPLPWPGMPDTRPLPLDLTELPFEFGMFLGDNEQFKKRVDRLQLMRRIEDVWVPHLKAISGVSSCTV